MSSHHVESCLQGSKAARASAQGLCTLPTHIARIRKDGKDHIICGAIKSDGSGIAFSDQQGLHLYELPAPSCEAEQQDSAEPMAATTDQSELTVSSARVQQVAEGQAGRKLMRLSPPEDVPTFHELQYRPGSSHILGLTSHGSLVIVDTQTAAVGFQLCGYLSVCLIVQSLVLVPSSI